MMKLDIVIPAYNEEGAIENTVRRCLAAREEICGGTPVAGISITVVSDGSADRTEELARRFEPEIRVIAHPVNRGYGAAIKTGFAAGDGELVAFLDADGTCDPRFFAGLVKAMLAANASVGIGTRMGPGSKMPAVRRLGNRLWRFLINWIARTRITDAASGMRVLRRDALPALEPLPDGLHFTPTMSCRASLDARLSAVEVPMEYEERVGRSKLNVVKDGLRFLKTILDVGLTYQPFRVISVSGLVMVFVAAVLFLPVAHHYAVTRTIPEWNIYRILAGLVATTAGFQMFLAGLALERFVGMVHPKRWSGGRVLQFLKVTVTDKSLLVMSAVLLLGAFALNADGILTWLRERHVYQHWSRSAFGGVLALVGVQCFAAAILERALTLLAAARTAAAPDSEADSRR